MRETFTALVAVVALALLPAPPAFAQVPAKVQQACNSDYRKLCANVAPGGGRILACLKARGSEVSEACRAALHDEQSKRGAGRSG